MTLSQPTITMKDMSVLIADDDRTMRSMLSEILRTCGLKVVGEVNDGKEAVAHYHKIKPDIVCLDMYMPVMSGIEALTAIRNVSTDVIVLLITGSATTDFVKSAVAARVDGIIAKPFSVKRISDEIARCVARAAERTPVAPSH